MYYKSNNVTSVSHYTVVSYSGTFMTVGQPTILEMTTVYQRAKQYKTWWILRTRNNLILLTLLLFYVLQIFFLLYMDFLPKLSQVNQSAKKTKQTLKEPLLELDYSGEINLQLNEHQFNLCQSSEI